MGMDAPQNEHRSGSVALVGAGPGDPELLTLKALRVLQEAEVVVFDRLVSQDILDMIPAGVSRIYAGKALNRHHMPQEEINDLLVTLAHSGRRVVRLKGGDPFVFGRGSEEALRLAAAGIPFEVVPGITAAQGCGTYAGIPLTHRGLSTGVRYITGHFRAGEEDLDHDWAKLADPETTLVFYMGLTNLPRIRARLIAHGLSPETPAAAVQNGSTEGQRSVIGTLADLDARVKAADLKAPAVLIIGRVVSLADRLSWFSPAAASVPDWTESDAVMQGNDGARHDQDVLSTAAG